MSDLVRTVRSGSVGLDLVLGGGPRLLQRIAGSPSESAVVLVRGGPGTGKSVLAADFAMRMARALGGDVLYTCVEILPREVIAQRLGFDGFDARAAIDLANPDARKTVKGPILVAGMTEMEPSPAEEEAGSPDVGGMIVDLYRLACERGCSPKVVVVDSLSDGYQLGAAAPRALVDGVCKLAVQQGWLLVLVEEAIDDRESPWSFAVDTVLSLSVTPAGRREVKVTKHRFGSCQPGPHRLLIERGGVRVIPSFEAYRSAVRDLELPEPATRRSLRVPGVRDFSAFDLRDGEGRIVLVSVPDKPETDPQILVTAAIGATSQFGLDHPDARSTLGLWELDELPRDVSPTGFVVGTLHQMVDGEEWLEGAFAQLSAIEGPLARVRVGPTRRIVTHDKFESLQRAIDLFAGILARRGLLVVVYGSNVSTIVRPGIWGEDWSVSEGPEKGGIRITRAYRDDRFEIDVLTRW